MKIFLTLLLFTNALFSQDKYDAIVSKIGSVVSVKDKVSILQLESFDKIEKDGKIISDKIFTKLYFNKFNVFDPLIFKKAAISSLSDLTADNAKELKTKYGIKYIIGGSCFRKNSSEINVVLRVINLDDLSTSAIIEDVLKADWKIDSNQIKTGVLKPKKGCKEIELVEIAEENLPSPESNYMCTFFSCGEIDCSKYNVRTGIYKIYFNDDKKTVITVSDDFKILQKYETEDLYNTK